MQTTLQLRSENCVPKIFALRGARRGSCGLHLGAPRVVDGSGRTGVRRRVCERREGPVQAVVCETEVRPEAERQLSHSCKCDITGGEPRRERKARPNRTCYFRAAEIEFAQFRELPYLGWNRAWNGKETGGGTRGGQILVRSPDRSHSWSDDRSVHLPESFEIEFKDNFVNAASLPISGGRVPAEARVTGQQAKIRL